MKTMILTILVSLAFVQPSFAQGKKEAKKVKKAVQSFVSGADARDVEAVSKVLAPEFRAVINRQMGSTELSVIDRSTYLALMGEGKIGGDERKLEVLSLDVEGEVASVKLRLTGKALQFTTHMSLVQTAEGNWLIAQDLPRIQKL